MYFTIYFFYEKINEIGDEAEKMRRDNPKSHFSISSMGFSSFTTILFKTDISFVKDPLMKGFDLSDKADTPYFKLYECDIIQLSK